MCYNSRGKMGKQTEQHENRRIKERKQNERDSERDRALDSSIPPLPPASPFGPPMASGYPGRDLRASYGIGYGSPLQFPYQQFSDSAAGGGGGGGGNSVLKRSMTELERQQQQQMQHVLFMRSVKQRTHLANISADFPPICSPASSSTTTSFSSGFRCPPSNPDTDRNFTMQNRLQELERQLLDDDEEDVPSGSDSAVTAAELGETMQHLISPPLPPPAAAAALSSPSPTTSTSSTTSSTASCSPASATPSRQLLLDTAAAVADGAMDTAAANLAVLNRAADRRGDPEQRLTSIMVAALISRMNPRSSPPIADPGTGDTQSATQLLFDLCPCFKLGLLAANLAILDATRDSPKIHILDFDVGQGGQHAAFITALADRHSRAGTRPPAVKITAVTETNTNLNIVGDRIASLAERMGVALRFKILKCRINDLDTGAIGSEPGEALAVNLAFYLSRVADESVSPANPRDALLRHMRTLAPRVVVLVEQELNVNTAPFLARFSENCGHYGALLESLDATAARESAERLRVEAGIGLKAVNSVAREGAERVERCEVFGKWRARMGMAGLRPVELGPAVCDPVRARLGSLRGNPGFSVREEGGGLCFGWMGRMLTVASAWR